MVGYIFRNMSLYFKSSSFILLAPYFISILGETYLTIGKELENDKKLKSSVLVKMVRGKLTGTWEEGGSGGKSDKINFLIKWSQIHPSSCGKQGKFASKSS